jgi:hypothetical protein
MPEKAAAAEGASACNFLFSGAHSKTGDYYANYHLEGCGWGAEDYDVDRCNIVSHATKHELSGGSTGWPFRSFVAAETDELVGLSLQAWEPLFESMQSVLGPELFVVLRGEDWRESQAAADVTPTVNNEGKVLVWACGQPRAVEPPRPRSLQLDCAPCGVSTG